MISDDEVRKFAVSLLSKSVNNQVAWERKNIPPDDPDFGSRKKTCYAVTFPKSAIQLEFTSPYAEPDFISFDILNDRGEFVRRWKVTDGGEDWNFVNQLYLDAERYVTKWDQVRDDLNAALASSGTIGTKAD